MIEERRLSDQELKDIQVRIDMDHLKPIDKDNHDDGYDLYYRVNHHVYRLCCDHDSWVILAYQGNYPEYQE